MDRESENLILFLEVLQQDMLRNPKRLVNLDEVWDNEWDRLLEGVDISEEL